MISKGKVQVGVVAVVIMGFIGVLIVVLSLLTSNRGSYRPESSQNTSASASGPLATSSAERVEASLIDYRIVPWTGASNGRAMQMVIVSWKNTGTRPIAYVDAEITAYDSRGNVLASSVDSYCIFAAERLSARVLPGATYTDPPGEGFVLIPDFDGVMASSIRVRLTEWGETNELIDQ